MIFNIILEGFGMCVIAFSIFVFLIKQGAVGLVVLYSKDMQEKIVELGLTTSARIKKNALVINVYFIFLYAAYLLVCVYMFNGARGFFAGFWQMTVILLIMGLSDRLIMEALLIGHAKACIIQGAEGLRPYITSRKYIENWIRTIIGYPTIAAIISGIMTIFLK